MSVFKILIFLTTFMWVLVSGMSVAFISMCEGTVELKAKPMWFVLLATILTSLSGWNILYYQIANLPVELKRRR